MAQSMHEGSLDQVPESADIRASAGDWCRAYVSRNRDRVNCCLEPGQILRNRADAADLSTMALMAIGEMCLDESTVPAPGQSD